MEPANVRECFAELWQENEKLKQRVQILESENAIITMTIEEATETMRLRDAAICVAALANTRDAAATQRLGDDSPLRTPGYKAVVAAVEREMALREEFTQHRNALGVKLDLMHAPDAGTCWSRLGLIGQELSRLREWESKYNGETRETNAARSYAKIKPDETTGQALRRLYAHVSDYEHVVAERDRARNLAQQRGADACAMVAAQMRVDKLTEGMRQIKDSCMKLLAADDQS